MDQPKMKYSDNPYIDSIVYYTKYLIINSIMKDETEADSYETIESIKNAGEYIRRVKFEKGTMPEYVELNLYYATLWGQPPVPTVDEIVEMLPQLETGYQYDKNAIDVSAYKDAYYINMEPYQGTVWTEGTSLDLTGKFIHNLTESELVMIEATGLMDHIKSIYTDYHYKYVNYLRIKIDPIVSRTATNYQMLYIPEIPDTDYNDIRSKFEIIFEKNKRYVMNAIYSDAMKLENEYYDKFIIILLKVMSMMDMVNDVFDYLIHKDVFDSRTIRYLFESYGVDYYSEIPTRYQVAMIKNMNTLLKYKSTNRNIVDITNLFGFDNVVVFKYYLLKVHDDNVPLEFDADGKEIFTNGAYDLEFVKVPIDGKIDDYISDPTYREPYDEVIANDPFWLAINKNQTDVFKADDINVVKYDVKQQILKSDFTCEATKYFSIDSTVETAQTAADLCYFYQMLYDNYIEDFTIDLPNSISVDPVPVSQVFAYMTALGYVYNDIEDDIITNDMEKTMYVYGFQFNNINIGALIDDVKKRYKNVRDGFTDLDAEGGIDLYNNYKLPPITDFTYDRFEEIFISNRDVHDKLIEWMDATDNYNVYKGYETIYNSLMTTKCSLKYFSKMYFGGESEQEIPTTMTYTEWFETVNPTLARSINACKEISNTEKRNILITEIFDECVYALKDVLTNERFDSIYNILPTKSADFLVNCIVKVVNFFKSYKAQFISSSAILTFNDRDNKMDILEDTDEQFTLELPQSMSPLDYTAVTFVEQIHDNESVGTFDKVYVVETNEE